MVKNLVELLRVRRSVRAVLVEVLDGAERKISFRDLDRRSDEFAGGLAAFGDLQGLPVPIAIRSPLDFAIAFFGVAKAGAVPVPSPSHVKGHPGHRRRFEQILADMPRTIALVEAQMPEDLVSATGVQMVLFSSVDALEWDDGPISPTAYHQYSSGSFGVPHPIALRHGNVLAQLAQAARAYSETPHSLSVNWVPLFHDMGLVTGLLRPLWSGYSSVMLDPFDFVKDAAIWPREITRWRATHTSAPDFGYALTAAKTQRLEGLDLSSLVVARNAGEMVRPSTLKTFSDRFLPVGFRSSAFAPSFGLAEATLTVTSVAVEEEPRVVAFSFDGLRKDRALPSVGLHDQVLLASAGVPLAGTQVDILDDSGDPLQDGMVGEIQVTGPQVSGGVVKTGDMGFILDGELFPLGRARERFQVAGVNYYSGEIERSIADALPHIRAGRVAVFVAFPESPQAKVVVQCETKSEASLDERDEEEIRMQIRALLSREFGISARVIEIMRARSLPVTTSGKLQRSACRQRFEFLHRDDGERGPRVDATERMLPDTRG